MGSPMARVLAWPLARRSEASCSSVPLGSSSAPSCSRRPSPSSPASRRRPRSPRPRPLLARASACAHHPRRRLPSEEAAAHPHSMHEHRHMLTHAPLIIRLPSQEAEAHVTQGRLAHFKAAAGCLTLVRSLQLHVFPGLFVLPSPLCCLACQKKK